MVSYDYRLGQSFSRILSFFDTTARTFLGVRSGGPRDEESRRSARYVLHFARQLRPRWIVLENVIQMRLWAGYDPLIDELKGFGYYVRPQILDAACFGVPQTRRRLFLLCDRERLPDPVTAPAGPVRAGREILDAEGVWRSTPLQNGRRAGATLERAWRAIKVLGRGRSFLIVYYGSDGAGGWHHERGKFTLRVPATADVRQAFLL